MAKTVSMKRKTSRRKALSPSNGSPPIIKDRIKELRRVPGRELIANPGNWRTHPKGQREALAGVLSQIGIADALIARETRKGLELIDGHLRVEDNPNVDWPVLVLDVTKKEADGLLATIDPLAAMATVDRDRLAAMVNSVMFKEDATKAMLEALARDNQIEMGAANGELLDPPAEIDKVDQLRRKWKIKKGQLWEITGPSGLTHRLLCGDSTDEKDVMNLMGSDRAGLMNTDPPYGVSYATDARPNPGVAKPRVANDGLQDEQLQHFLESCFRLSVSDALEPNAAWYMWHAHLTQGYFAAAAAAAAAANVILHRQIIWVKPALLLGRGQYHWKHEPCFMGWVKGNLPPDYGAGNGERTQTTVWQVDSVSNVERKEMNHSTPKPVELFRIPIVKHLKPTEIAYEPFAGSGPQLLAAEQLGRRCFGLEIEPKYVAVILDRMKKIGCQCEMV